MDLDPPEQSRERAVSSEPCSTRPNPFDNDNGSSRKRQRVSSGESRSRSVDARSRIAAVLDPTASIEPRVEEETQLAQPQTPIRTSPHKVNPEPTSAKVTINLKRALEPGSSPLMSPSTPFKASGVEQIPESLVVPDSKNLQTSASMPVEISSSPSSAVDSPKIELVSLEEDQEPAVAIIGDLLLEDEEDPMTLFPYSTLTESLAATVRKIARLFEYENVDSDEAFCKLRDWIDKYLDVTAGQEASWGRSYENFRDFWEQLPEVVSSLSRRRNFFGQFLHKSLASRRSLTEFFIQFARLAARFVIMDVNMLAQYDELRMDDKPPNFTSRPYLLAFGWLLRKEDAPHIGRNLETHYRWNWNDDVSLLMNSFLSSGASIPALTKLVQGQLASISQSPKLVDDLTEPCRIVHRAVADTAFIMNEPDQSHQQHVETAQQMISQGYEFYKVMAAGLVLIIEKHVTFLTPEAASAHIIGLTQILYFSMAYEGCPASELVEQHRQSHPLLPEIYTPLVVSTEWKFEMLKKLIISSQMQLRVIGVTTMCNDLLNMFTKNKKDDPTRHPLLLHLAHLILKNKLVDYIVGIGSHPELISESGNIVGFLIATKTYSEEQTDKIWRTVTTSQDPRVVDAVLRMLMSILNLKDYDTLLYLCQKVGELPIEAFTVPMRDYCERLLGFLVQRASIDRALSVDAPPYELCVRLMRESSIPDAPAAFLDIQQFAALRLRELILHGPESEIRNKIYVSCIEDMSDRSSTATGSICALYGLLRQNFATDLHILTANHGLTRLMIEDLEHTSSTESTTAASLCMNSPVNQARRELLLAIIVNDPATITPDLGIRLWNTFVGHNARSHADREIAWQILNAAVKKASAKNIFIATCFQEYLPRLEPFCFTIGALDFTREAIVAWFRETQGDLLDGEQNPGSNTMEQLWRMILTAPPNTIEGPAVNILVELYVESHMVMSMARARAHAVHLSLVNRCLKQLSSAASQLKSFTDGSTSGDDEPMVIVASENQIYEQELVFTRSLLLLREFLRVYQSKSLFIAPKRKYQVTNASSETKGEIFDLKYQTFDGDNCSAVEVLLIGKSNTIAELFVGIRKATGFKSCKMYHWGKEINPEEMDVTATLDALGIGNGLVLVLRHDDDTLNGMSRSRSSSLELEIINHFDELWDYLGMEEKLSQEIYYFLIKFPVYRKLLDSFENDETSFADMFPMGQPFKCLYAVYALRENLVAQSQDGVVNGATVSKAIGLIVAAISSQAILDSCASQDLRCFLAQTLVDCLVKLLREPMMTDSVGQHLTGTVLDRLLQLITEAQALKTVQLSAQLVSSSFEAILEASLFSPQLWAAFMSHPKTPRLLYDLLLDDPRTALRRSIMKQISNKCSFTSSLSRLSTIDFAMAFWPFLNELVPQAVVQSQKCDETLSLALVIFRKLADTSIESMNLDACLMRWGSLLVNHEPQEDVGHPEKVDMIARGLANLLYWCTSFSKASEHPLPPNNLAMAIFMKHLFPESSENSSETGMVEPIPLLNTATRKLMADTIIFLTKDDKKQYQQVMRQLLGLVAYHPNEDSPYTLELGFLFDRSKSIRSPTGYVGLKNLSNTCYLNSLFTQLFMNVDFRGFMLNANVADGGTAQKLLAETQKLFAFMQNSLKRFIDPTNLAGSIRTYDDTNIDVTIQMDVDEFYNLLFDRWESQILAPADKRTFRSFYGGQLVQQVKSKECDHISERLEPFSAIQCDIKGKTSLQESLQAYVDGEVMEGDNKYKCSSCDRHVNAVKRACLKDVPDNLIFHLKRFDFNLRTMQRSKINDYFSFPHRIDMRPYKVEHLMESPGGTLEDIFELVGILVHSGTAESGHYYSYIRERPSSGPTPTWVEFNDDHVVSFDPTYIEANCFGGVDFRGPESGTFQFDKSWSAYMLFYQRSSVLQDQQHELILSKRTHPIRLPIVPSISEYIVGENELLMRKYCLHDESHAPFVLRMLDNVQNLNQGQCSQRHELEKLAVTTALSHLDQVVARAKDLPDFGSYMLTLLHRFQNCADCSRDFLEWLIECPEAFRQLLFKNPDQVVRGEIVTAVITALVKVKKDAMTDYGIYEEANNGDEMDLEVYEPPRLFNRVLDTLFRFWETFHLSTRAWPEYFGLLGNMAHLGTHEAIIMLDTGFLFKILEVLSWDAVFAQHHQYTRMIAIINKRPATKPVSLENAIALLEILLETCDLGAETIQDHEISSRFELSQESEPIPLTRAEHSLLIQHWPRGHANILVDKLLTYNQNERSTQSIIAMMLKDMEDDAYPGIYHAIRNGIRKATPVTSVAPFLRAALTYCENGDDFEGIGNMIKYISNVTRGLDNGEGKEHFRFFKDLPETAPRGVDHGEFFRFVIGQIPTWAPCLLTFYESGVRTDTEDYIQATLFTHGPSPDVGSSETGKANARTVVHVARALGISCLRYLHEEHVRPRLQAVRVNLFSIQAVIEGCKSFFDETGGDGQDEQFREFYDSVIPALKKLTVEQVDDEVSEWENSDDAFSSSEVMDSITELCATGGDLNEAEV